MSHLTNKEMNDAIHRVTSIYHKENEEEVSDEREVVAYGNLAQEVDEKGPAAYAKVIRIGNSTTYWILFNPNSQIFNPYGLYEESRRFKGKKAHQFRKVSPNTFKAYFQYLQTKNHSWYAQAERENI